MDALREQGDSAAIRELCERWLRELLEMPAEPDPVVCSMKMVTLSCMAFWLAALPPAIPFDGELAVRAAELAAEQGNDTRDNNWTRLALVHLRLGHQERAAWALKESMNRRNGGDRFDWMVQALLDTRRGDLVQRTPGSIAHWRETMRATPQGSVTGKFATRLHRAWG